MKQSNYYFDDDTDDDTDVFNPETGLPFPAPLDRDAFLNTDFNAADFLASLTSRFQTLEDLQTELQELLKSLNKELVDLVNDNYTSFVLLGDKLKGGEERIEDIRVGLLGFQRDITGLRNLIDQRSTDVRVLLDDKRELRKQIRRGRELLEIDERLFDLELRLGLSKPDLESDPELNSGNDADELASDFKDWPDHWLHTENEVSSLSECEDAEDAEAVPSRLTSNLQHLQHIQGLLDKCGKQHPFILSQRDRVSQIKDTMGKDLETTIRSQPNVKIKQKLIQIRAQLEDDRLQLK